MNRVAWDRACVLTVAPPLPGQYRNAKTQDAMVIKDLRVEFRIDKTPRKEPNTCSLMVYNLNPESRAKLTTKGSRVWLEAGYTGNTSLIFVGDARYISHVRHSVDWVTKIELGDGARAYAHGRTNQSFKAGTSKGDILRAIAKQTGWNLGNVEDVAAGLAGNLEHNGFVSYGSAAQNMDRILSSQGLRWSVQNGAIQIMPKAGYLAQSAVVLDADHGLVGSPEMGSANSETGKRTLRVKCLLRPELRVGARVALHSAGYDAVFAVKSLKHEGDTWSGPWYSECELVAA
jgi:hypothetical protein